VCDPGEEGEIVHRGAFVALGYWNDPGRTVERFRPYPPGATPRPDVAVWSGDRAYRDHDGFLYFVGRADEMIKTSGYRVSPSEVEDTAYATGLVREAVAFGVPDDDLGQHIVLAVTGRDGTPWDPGPLRAALGRELPGYMVPRTVLTCAEIPRSSNGKFDLQALRRMVAR
jgi:acyl-CoA synthetase (AMP-forming)/AMP-acid ligase II